MKKATFSLTFNRKKRLNKEGKGTIDIYCYADGRAKHINTGVAILPDEWDGKRKVVCSHPNATKLNIMLSGMLNKIEDHELSIHNQRGEFTFDDLRKFSFNGSKNNFIDWLRKEIEEDNTVAPGTRAYRFNMLDKLSDAAGGSLPFSRVNYEIIKRFNNHMVSQGLNPSTQAKLHNQLKKFCTIAVHEDIIKKNPYDIYRIKKPVYNQKKVLWFPDLDRLWKLEYPADSDIELVRMKFLFSCYTGLRISDNTNLSWNQVRGGKLFVKMQKTARPVVVPVNVLDIRAQAILDKAKRLSGDQEKVFPYIHDQRVNTLLKKIGTDAEIPFPLTFHAARHTFCTLVAHRTGSVFEVMRFSGISKVETAMCYVNLNKMYSL